MPRRRGRGRVGGRRGGGRGRGRGRGGQSVGKFLAPRTGRQAGAIANAQAGAEYNPEIRELRQQAKGSRKRQMDLGSWYAQLASDYEAAQNAGAAALQSIQDTTSQQLAEAGQRSSADLSRLSAEDAEFAKLVGGPKDTEGLARIAQASAAAQRSRVALNQPVAAEQANFVARLGSDKTAARMQGIESRREEARRRDKIKSDLAAVRKEKGLARVARKEEIRAADRNYAMQLKQLRLARREARSAEQQAAADAAIAQIEAAREARQDAIANRQAQERIGIARKNAATSARAQRATARNYRQDNRRLAREAKVKKNTKLKNAAAAAKRAIALEGMPKNAKQWAIVEQYVAEASGVSDEEARRVVARMRRGRKAARNLSYEDRIRRGEVAGPPRPRKRRGRGRRRRR